MDPKHLDELVELEDSYWWHVAKRDLVMSLLDKHFAPPGRIVEGGIGSARNLLEFQEAGYHVTGYDVMQESVDHARQRGLEDCHVHDLHQPWPLEKESTRAVVLLDVLEHLADPVAVLKNAYEILEPGGGVVATVPAYKWLFGKWDGQLGHYRRYTANELREHAEAAGFTVTWQNRWNSFTLPAALAVRTWSKVFPKEAESTPEFPRVSTGMNQALLTAASVERSVMKRFGVPVGLSLVGVFTK